MSAHFDMNACKDTVGVWLQRLHMNQFKQHQLDERTLKCYDFLSICSPEKLNDDDFIYCAWRASIISMLMSCILWILQRYCRGFLFSHKHPQKHQSAVIVQAAIRRIIAQKQYNRLKFGVTDINNYVLLYFNSLVITLFIWLVYGFIVELYFWMHIRC